MYSDLEQQIKLAYGIDVRVLPRRPSKEEIRWGLIVEQIRSYSPLTRSEPSASPQPHVERNETIPKSNCFIRLTPARTEAGYDYSVHFPIDRVIPKLGDVVQLVVSQVSPRSIDLELQVVTSQAPNEQSSGLMALDTDRRISDYV